MVGIVMLSLLGVLSHWGLTRLERVVIPWRHTYAIPLGRRTRSCAHRSCVLLALLAVWPRLARRGPGTAKVKVGVLKLTSSAPVFVGVEKGFFKDLGIEPELVFFQAAAPIATALAAGPARRRRHRPDGGALQHRPGRRAALDRGGQGARVAGLSARRHRRAEGALGRGAPVDRGSQGQAHRGDPARLDLPLPHRQYSREERAQARRRQDRAAPGHARHRRGIEGQAGRRHPRAPALSRRHRGAGLRQDPRVGRRSLPVADRDDLLLEGLRRGSSARPSLS